MPDDTLISMTPPILPEARSATPAGNRDEWLAQLEDAAFTVQDDSLRQHRDDHVPRAEELPGTLRHHEPAPLDVPRHQTIIALQNALAASGNRTPSAASAVVRPGAAYLPGNSAATVGNPALASPPNTLQNQPVAQRAALAPRLEHLINRLQFSELNVSVTSRGDEMTLWVRDFKQKYGSELFHWVQDLGQFLQGNGKSLSRIMVNGKQIHHVNELLGGGKWQ